MTFSFILCLWCLTFHFRRLLNSCKRFSRHSILMEMTDPLGWLKLPCSQLKTLRLTAWRSARVLVFRWRAHLGIRMACFFVVAALILICKAWVPQPSEHAMTAWFRICGVEYQLCIELVLLNLITNITMQRWNMHRQKLCSVCRHKTLTEWGWTHTPTEQKTENREMAQSMIYQCDSSRRFVFKCSWGTSTPFCLKSRSQVLQLRIFSSESLA